MAFIEILRKTSALGNISCYNYLKCGIPAHKEGYVMDVKFYRCKHCGQIVAIVKATGVPVVCCGEPMEELIPGTVDAALEKHVPVYEVQDGVVTVKVGSVEHPSLPEHYIGFIALVSGNTIQRAELKPGDKPEAVFYIDRNASVDAVYEYCNLHGLWKA